MSQLAEDARVTLLIADYVGVDASNKVNALGAGFTMTGVNPTGLTPPMHLVVLIDIPSKYAGQDFALLLELRDDKAGKAVQVTGPNGTLEALRIQQVARGDRPQVQGAHVPDSVPVRVQVAMAFPGGLPLAANNSYTWRVELDGQHRKGWDVTFHVLGPPPPPVFGGQATSPTDINLPPLT